MATFTINASVSANGVPMNDYYTDIGSGGQHDATEWQICKNKYFSDHLIIDKAIITQADVSNSIQHPDMPQLSLLKWSSPLPKLPVDKTDPAADEYYEDLREFWVRVRIYVNYGTQSPSVSPWVVIGPYDQLDQNVTITQDEKIIRETTAKDLGWAPEILP